MKKLAVGGQAVIEGVMMRSPGGVATAVRNSKGEIVVDAFCFVSLSKRSKFWGIPVIRGAVNLWEALYLGIKTLNWSAGIASMEETEDLKSDKGIGQRILSVLSLMVAFGLGLGIFMYIPYLVSGLLSEASGSQLLFHSIAGFFRIGLFLLYIYLISLWREIRRVFEYHGAEHKSIFAYERNGATDVESAAVNSRFHPRCGTSFILITAVMIILLFALFDSALIPLIGEYRSPLHRLLVHLPFIPLVAGISYEVLKYSGERSERGLWRMMVKPGLWLQHITTREPDTEQLEVAVVALRRSLDFMKKD